MHIRQPMPRMLFIRDYLGLLGGHLKVFDYMSHIAAMGRFLPALYCTKTSLPIPSHFLPENLDLLDRIVTSDAYFVAGLDWIHLDSAGIDTRNAPVINFIQGLRHADPLSTHYRFLDRPALRICVSDVVADAVRTTGRVNGAIKTIHNGIGDFTEFARPVKTVDLFIAGAKNPQLAREVAAFALERGLTVDLLTDFTDRRNFLERMASAEIAVALPLPIDGFFLPGIEAMALGCIAIVPNCPGAGSYCIDGKTGFSPQPNARDIFVTIQNILADPQRAASMRQEANLIVSKHTLSQEREMFSTILAEYLQGFR